MRPALASLVLGALIAAVRPAAAEPTERIIPVVRHESYLPSLVIADLAWVATGAFALGLDSDPLRIAAAAGFVAAGPAVHLWKQQPIHAAGSLGLRVALPLAGAAAGAAIDSERFGALEGAGVGAAAALLLDYALLSRRTIHESTRMWTPAVAAGAGGVALGVAGRF